MWQQIISKSSALIWSNEQGRVNVERPRDGHPQSILLNCVISLLTYDREALLIGTLNYL